MNNERNALVVQAGGDLMTRSIPKFDIQDGCIRPVGLQPRIGLRACGNGRHVKARGGSSSSSKAEYAGFLIKQPYHVPA